VKKGRLWQFQRKKYPSLDVISGGRIRLGPLFWEGNVLLAEKRSFHTIFVLSVDITINALF
jgi:hypothetical protein